jgi:type IV pilus modification protein PilV
MAAMTRVAEVGSHPAREGQQGTSLLEALIALLLMGLTLLGFGLMQMESLQANNESYARTEARILLISMAERIQANPDGVDDYAGLDTESAGNPGNCPCSVAELAARDVAVWADRLEDSGLNAPVGAIASSGSDLLTLTLGWSGAAPLGQNADSMDADAQALSETLQIRVVP